jgi:hypothetical protein
MDIKNRKRKKTKTLFFFFSFSLEGAPIGKKNRRTRDYDSYMIRVGSMSDCCCDVAGREAKPAFNDIDGVLNGDCLLCKSDGVSSVV